MVWFSLMVISTFAIRAMLRPSSRPPGKDLALVTGRGGAELTNLEGLHPLVQERDVVAIGWRSDDAYTIEVQQHGHTCLRRSCGN